MAKRLFKTLSSNLVIPNNVAEGVGARIFRLIGDQKAVKVLDPFILFDQFHMKRPLGLPDHPHYGMEAVTYMLQGTILHEDFTGNKGTLKPGEIQQMMAGKGIVHAEMPGSFEEETVGFQVFVNLDEKNKNRDPYYKEFNSDKAQYFNVKDALVKVIAGNSYGVTGPVQTCTPIFYLDIHLPKNYYFEQTVPEHYQGLVYLYEGEATAGQNQVNIQQYQAASFEVQQENTVNLKSGNQGAKLVVLAGKPIHEQVFNNNQFFYHNNKEGLKQILDNYAQMKNGFENCKTWSSKIQNSIPEINRQEYLGLLFAHKD
ncbi:hypothetical protein ABPG74_009755 [Tetrahymena malaccensis]